MKSRITFVLLISMFLVFLGCDLSFLKDTSGELSDPVEIELPANGLHDYAPADLESVIIEGRVLEFPEDFSDLSDTALLSLIYPSITEFLEEGYLSALLNALGLDFDTIFTPDHIRPRAITFDASLHVLDEGVVLRNELRSLFDVNVHFLDILASGSSVNFMKFLFNTIDGDQWVYSNADANMYGNLGLSLKLDATPIASEIESDLYRASASACFNIDIASVSLGNIVFEKGGKKMEVYFPKKGNMKFQIGASMASSALTYIEEDTTNIGGYPVLDGNGAYVYGNYYCPYRIWLKVEESDSFSCQRVYELLRKMLTSSSGLANEQRWNQLCDIVWASQTAPHITLGVDILDDGSGNQRNMRLSDYALLQFLLLDL